MHNLRYALRTLAKSPGFAFTAILTLAVGIGASTAIFTTVDAVLLHPLPYPNASQLMQVTKNMPKFELFKSDASALDFIDYRDLSRSFSHMAAMQTNAVNLTGDCRTGGRLRIARRHEPVPDARRAAYRGPRVPS